MANVRDSGVSESKTKAQMFVLASVDGNPVQNSIGASASASFGMGAILRPTYISRKVPARQMKVTLRGTHVTGAPIHTMFLEATGKLLSVEGTVDFTPYSGGLFIVKGELKPTGSSVWIEDVSTGMPVTSKVTSN